MGRTRRAVTSGFAAALAAAALPGVSEAAADYALKPDDRWIGKPSARITVIEYFSPVCPHCGDWEREVWPAFKAKYVKTGKVRFVARELPTAPGNLAAAGFVVARCAPAAKYFNVVEALFAGQQALFDTHDGMTWINQGGAAGGLTPDQVLACVQDSAQTEALNTRVQTGVAEFNVDSTPTFIIRDRKLVGKQSLAELDAVLQPLLRGKR